MAFLKQFYTDNSGATAIEYAIMIGVIAIGMIVGVTAIGNKAGGLFELTNNGFK